MTLFNTQKSLSMAAAVQLAQITQSCAADAGFRMNVVVVDRAGIPLAIIRNPDAPLASLEFSERKAFTAASFGWATGDWQEIVKDRPLVAQGLSQHPKFCMIAGGVPIKFEGETLGALGVSGAKAPEDHQIAMRALEQFLSEVGVGG